MSTSQGDALCTQVGDDVSRRALAAGYLALPDPLALGDHHRLTKQLDAAYAAVVQSLYRAGPYYLAHIDPDRIVACALHARVSNRQLCDVDLKCAEVNAYLAFAELVSYY